MIALLEHLDRQIRSSQRLLQIVLDQSDAIRRQDAESVLASLVDVQQEMAARDRLEVERDQILQQASRALGVPADGVTLDQVLTLAAPADARAAREKSAELRGLIAEVQRVHGQNRVLIRQELSFLDHLMRAISGTPPAGYSPLGFSPAPQASHAVDARG